MKNSLTHLPKQKQTELMLITEQSSSRDRRKWSFDSRGNGGYVVCKKIVALWDLFTGLKKLLSHENR